VRACVHRVVPGAAPRRSLVMRLRANPDAALPLTFGPYWRCATVRAFNDRFAATHSSVNEPVRALAAPAPVAAAGASAPSATSLAETVLATADLAAAIVRCLGDDAVALARAELVCTALRDAVAPHWRRMCLALRDAATDRFSGVGLLLPRCIIAADARQWRTLHRCLTGQTCVRVKDQRNMVVQFLVERCTRWEKLRDAYCHKKNLCGHEVRFLFDGQRIGRTASPYALRMDDGDTVDAMMEQVGD
jgi:small ubiquitin-related modifier